MQRRRRSSWTAAWRYAEDGRIESSQFWPQEGRPATHFTFRLHVIKQMMPHRQTFRERRTDAAESGTLDALLLSLKESQWRIETPYLMMGYQPAWRWAELPAPPPMRPWSEQ